MAKMGLETTPGWGEDLRIQEVNSLAPRFTHTWGTAKPVDTAVLIIFVLTPFLQPD